MSTPHREQLEPRHSNRTGWLVGLGTAIAVIVAVVLLVYAGGGGSGGPGY